MDLLIRRLFGVKSEKLDAAQLELLLNEADLEKPTPPLKRRRRLPSLSFQNPFPNEKLKRSGANVGRKIFPLSTKLLSR